MAEQETALARNIRQAQRRQALTEGSANELVRAAAGLEPTITTVTFPVRQDSLFVPILADNSGSIWDEPSHGSQMSMADATRAGHNYLLNELLKTPNPDNIAVATYVLNGEQRIINPPGLLRGAVPLDRQNFRTGGGTPLHGRTVEMLAVNAAQVEQGRKQLVRVNTASLILSDGAANDQYLVPAEVVCQIITDMRRTGNHLIAAVGILPDYSVHDGEEQMRNIFLEMGIDPEWILTPPRNPEAIALAIAKFSEAAKRAAVGTNFRELVAGGFKALPEPKGIVRY